MSALRYAGECLFLNGYLDGRGILPQRPVWEVTGHAEPLSVVIDGEAAVEWFMNTALYTADLVSLCMLCKILDPKIVFEIGRFAVQAPSISPSIRRMLRFSPSIFFLIRRPC